MASLQCLDTRLVEGTVAIVGHLHLGRWRHLRRQGRAQEPLKWIQRWACRGHRSLHHLGHLLLCGLLLLKQPQLLLLLCHNINQVGAMNWLLRVGSGRSGASTSLLLLQA